MPNIPVRMSEDFARFALTDLRLMHANGVLPPSVVVLMLRLEAGLEKATRPPHAFNADETPQVPEETRQGREGASTGAHGN
jgi:hypothetical protein